MTTTDKTQTLEELLEIFDEAFTHKEIWGTEEMVFLNEGDPKKMKAFIKKVYVAGGEAERVKKDRLPLESQLQIKNFHKGDKK